MASNMQKADVLYVTMIKGKAKKKLRLLQINSKDRTQFYFILLFFLAILFNVKKKFFYFLG